MTRPAHLRLVQQPATRRCRHCGGDHSPTAHADVLEALAVLDQHIARGETIAARAWVRVLMKLETERR